MGVLQREEMMAARRKWKFDSDHYYLDLKCGIRLKANPGTRKVSVELLIDDVPLLDSLNFLSSLLSGGAKEEVEKASSYLESDVLSCHKRR